ncbi:MAG: nicotinate phosphoribosyltransferase [Candidatus Sungbacteria bacterium]|nr:nicotinate phosphoribosyltransferase [bacterium]MDZ4260607.1 nicotinate phosphoribosyltransferase [Candidatus Sungbacteria bacterium]
MAISTSVLDTDDYKFSMGQFIFHRPYLNVQVRFGFINRTKGVRMAEYISEQKLREELNAAREVRLTSEEYDFMADRKLGKRQMFQKDYLEFLRDFRLGPYDLEERDGNFRLEFSGPWSEATYWETRALPIISELYYGSVIHSSTNPSPSEIYAQGYRRHTDKLDFLLRSPRIRFSDFGTRRRASKDWQEYAVVSAHRTLGDQFLGTSNTYLAMKHHLKPVGTMAHELNMIIAACHMAGSDEELRGTQRQLLRDWEAEYGPDLLIALCDTWGSQFFLNKIFPEFARRWTGTRQDSGDPFAYGEAVIELYKTLRIDPQSKLIVFSDSLNVEIMEALAMIFDRRINVVFGLGTNFTNDLGIPTLSLIIKALQAAGRGTVKLPDNLAKAMGSPEDIARIIRVAGHTNTFFEECKS